MRKLPFSSSSGASWLALTAAVVAISSARADVAPDPRPTPPPPPAPLATTGESETPEMTPEEAKKAALAEVEKYGWEREGKGRMGSLAEVAIPQGYRFTPATGARKLMRFYGNLTGDSEQGVIAPENLDWFILFDFSNDGYVKDDEKDKLDADKIMASKKESEVAANEERKRQGIPALHIVDWINPPHYDEATHNLEWGLRLRSEAGGESANYNMKLLGRHGVMDATIVCDPDQLDTVLPEARKLIAGFNYQTGETYAEYRKGDKVAQYGLTGLAIGGAAVLAAKSGLFAGLFKILAKGGKAVIAAVIAVGVAIRRFFAKIIGGRTSA